MAARIISDVFIVIGLFFALAGTIGTLKMPDTFCRMQASTCISTMGMLGAVIGGIIYSVAVLGNVSAAVKIGMIGVMILLTNPIGAHGIARGAYKSGIRPEKEMKTDDYGRDFNE